MADQKLGTAVIGVEVETSKVETGTNRAKQLVRSLGTEAENASAVGVRATDRQVAALERQIATLGLSKDQVIQWRIAQQTSGPAAERLNAALDAQVAKLRAAGASTGQYNAALRSLPAQYTDVVTQIAGGQNLGLILLQQGGQIRDQFGSVGEALRGIGQSAAAVINPVTLGAAALAALGVAAYQGAGELSTLDSALISSGNAAGTTTQALVDLSASLDEIEGITRSKAVDALASVASTGAFTADQIGLVATAALEWSVATGTAVDDTVEQFKRLAQDPVGALIELNNQLGHVTEAQLEQIRTLIEQGRHTEAATEAIKLQAETLGSRAGEMVQNLGLLEKGWRAVRNTVVETWDAVRAIGRDNTTQQSLDQINALLRSMERTRNAGLQTVEAQAQWQRSYDALLAKAKALEESQKAATTATTEGDVASRRALAANNDLQDRLNKAKDRELSTAERIRKEALLAGVTNKQAVEELIRLEEAREAAQKARRGANAGDGGLGSARLATIRAEAQAAKSAIEVETRDLQAQYQAREVSANDYYRRLRELAERTTAAELDGLNKQVASLQSQTGKRKESGVVAEQVAALEAQISRARAAGEVRLRALTSQEEEAARKRQAGLQSYREALTAQTEALRGQVNSMIDRERLGSREYEVQTRLNEVYAEQARRLREIAQAQQQGLTSEEAESRREALRSEVMDRVTVIREGYDAADRERLSFQNGIDRGFADFAEQSKDIAGQVASGLNSAFDGAADAIVRFTQTGKLSFSDLARSILADLTRIALKIALTRGLESLFGGGAGVYTGGGSGPGSIAGFGNNLASQGGSFANGGYTGPGDKYQRAGDVHKGEVVFSQEDVARHGGPAATERLRLGGVGSIAPAGGGAGGGGGVTVNLIGLDKAPRERRESSVNGQLQVDLIFEEIDARAAEGVANGTSRLSMAIEATR